MNEQYISKCNEIFEEGSGTQEVQEELKRLQEYFDFQIPTEYEYILERYAGTYIKENYGFKALEKTPLTDKNGFDMVFTFFPLKGKNNIFEKCEMYGQQLPMDLIPIGELDGGNLLCLNRMNDGVYIWIHDEDGKNTHLVQKKFKDFIYSFEQFVCEDDTDLGIVETKFSASFLDALKSYKK